mmetsp:Transcript_9533/g.18550  ORF Transcript_9533/g.18550 Transcript_9533/m.18550 type:complete len:98 (+) Transcript_9533:298-591(+)
MKWVFFHFLVQERALFFIPIYSSFLPVREEFMLPLRKELPEKERRGGRDGMCKEISGDRVREGMSRVPERGEVENELGQKLEGPDLNGMEWKADVLL